MGVLVVSVTPNGSGIFRLCASTAIRPVIGATGLRPTARGLEVLCPDRRIAHISLVPHPADRDFLGYPPKHDQFWCKWPNRRNVLCSARVVGEWDWLQLRSGRICGRLWRVDRDFRSRPPTHDLKLHT